MHKIAGGWGSAREAYSATVQEEGKDELVSNLNFLATPPW